MIAETIKTFLLQLKDVFVNFNFFSDTLDILVVALIVYAIIVQMRKTQAIQVVKGIVFLAVIYGVVSLLGMSTSTYFFSKLFSDILIIFVILFSGEIRQALELIGKRKIGTKFSFFEQSEESVDVDMINCVCRACGAMGRNKVGSLILIQRETFLGDYMKQAVPIDAQITFESLCSIFYPKAPLHDGAVILKNGRIIAARCVVPLKNDREITENVGTRHRAALEASLNSDCIAVVTSEETGTISIAVDGQLIRGFTDSELREELGKYLLSDNSKKKDKQTEKENKKKAKEEKKAAKKNKKQAEKTEEAEDVTIAENTETAEPEQVAAPTEPEEVEADTAPTEEPVETENTSEENGENENGVAGTEETDDENEAKEDDEND